MTAFVRLRRLWPIPVLALLVCVAYWPGRGGGYVFDDFPNIVNNTALHVTSLDWRAWVAALFSSEAGTLNRPIAMLSFALNHYFTGLAPQPMKWTNVAIHALNACLVLGLVRALLALAMPSVNRQRREWAARFTAAAWALHPINLMAVLFVVQRMESLSHAFVFAGLWLYLLGRQRQLAGKGGWTLILAGLVGGTALGALSKESALLLPLYAALLEACVPTLRTRAAKRGLKAVFVIVLALPAIIGSAWLLHRYLPAQAFARRDFTLGERLLTEGRVVLDYLRWTLFPSLRELSLYHDDFSISHTLMDPPATMLALAGLALVAVAAWAVRRRHPLVTLGIAWFFAAQLLTATIVPLELVFEHRNYFASLGICLVLADLLLLLPSREAARRIGILLAALWLAALALTICLRASEWSDPLRFAATEAAKHPQSPRATFAYGHALTIVSGYRPDSPYVPKAEAALEHARTVPRSGILPLSALLLLAENTGRPVKAEWWTDMQARLRKYPVGVQDAGAIASLRDCMRDGPCTFPKQRMQDIFDAALSHGPNAEIINIQAGYTLNVLHQPDVALDLWRRAIELKPKTAQYRINHIKLLIALGRRDDASMEIAALRRLGSFGQHAGAADRLEQTLGSSGRAPAMQDP